MNDFCISRHPENDVVNDTESLLESELADHKIYSQRGSIAANCALGGAAEWPLPYDHDVPLHREYAVQ